LNKLASRVTEKNTERETVREGGEQRMKALVGSERTTRAGKNEIERGRTGGRDRERTPSVGGVTRERIDERI
jgi:hypothetical protein